MPGLDITIGSDQYKTIDVPESCTCGRWKQFIAEGLLGQKILYAEKLVFRSKLGGPALEDQAPLPVAPERLFIEGRPPVVKILQLALKDKLKPARTPSLLTHPKPAAAAGWHRNTLAAGKDGVETAAAKVFAQELDEATIRRIWKRFPSYKGELPEAAVFWSEGDLERFFASNGQLRPCEVAEPGGQTCALLRKLRLELAERGVSKVPADYVALGRHLAQTDPDTGTEVPRLERFPKVPREPCVVQWTPGQWDLEFWRKQHGDWLWGCRARVPAFAGDDADVLLTANVSDYVEYARVLFEEDPACEAEAAMAYFRVYLEGWPAFTQAMWPVFERSWRTLTPPGLEDLTVRWVRMYADKFGVDWLLFFARFFKVALAAPGTIDRLHRENFGAHLWLSLIEGRKLIVLFPPGDFNCLYPSTGDRVDCKESYTTTVSPVDIFAPNLKRHPKFAEAKPRFTVLRAGETLVVPKGWWWYAATLEPSASVQQAFFNSSNHGSFTQELEDKMLQYGELSDESAAKVQDIWAQLREEIAEDNEDWGLVVTEGGS